MEEVELKEHGIEVENNFNRNPIMSFNEDYNIDDMDGVDLSNMMEDNQTLFISYQEELIDFGWGLEEY